MQLLIMDVTTIEIIFDNRVTTVIDMKKNCQKSFQVKLPIRINSNYQ
jgi:hypothetical protein